MHPPGYKYLPGLEGHIWYAAYRREIQTCVVDYLFTKVLADKLDSRSVWEILKLREQANPPGGRK
jgi:hypothetical protein